MNGIVDFVKAFGPGRIAAMGAVTALMIGFFALIMMRMSAPHMVPLFTDLALRDSNQIIRELERTNTPYELKQDGAVLLVSSDEVARLRMRLAEQGLPAGGGVGYEIFDKSESLGTTNFVQNINKLRALEGELARSISEIGRVQSTRVHLVIPERALFSRDMQEPTASIVLKLRGTLEQAQVKAIQHLVASAVPGMKPGQVSIVDESGRLLATGRGDDEQMMGTAMEEKSAAHENKLRTEIEDILTRIVGPGRARVQVAAELDWNRVTTAQETFDPDSKVVRSTQNKEEKNQTTPGDQRQVSVGNEVPGGANQNAGAAGGTPSAQGGDSAEKSEEVVNYEISKTSRTEILEAGRIKRISVAVLVDGLYSKDGETVKYEPRAQEEMDRIGNLVRSAVGFDEKRGDKVEIVNLRFAETPKIDTGPVEEVGFLGSFTMDDYMRIAETGVIFILGLLLVLFGVRPLLRAVLAPANGPAFAGAGGAFASNSSAQDALQTITDNNVAQLQGAAAAGTRPMMPHIDNATTKAIESAMMAGSSQKESIEKIGELVKGNPKEAAAVVRNWMSERAAG